MRVTGLIIAIYFFSYFLMFKNFSFSIITLNIFVPGHELYY